jgi:hypothetical protein
LYLWESARLRLQDSPLGGQTPFYSCIERVDHDPCPRLSFTNIATTVEVKQAWCPLQASP